MSLLLRRKSQQVSQTIQKDLSVTASSSSKIIKSPLKRIVIAAALVILSFLTQKSAKLFLSVTTKTVNTFTKISNKFIQVSSFSNYLTDGYLFLFGASALGINPFGTGSSSNQNELQKTVNKSIQTSSKVILIFQKFIQRIIISTTQTISSIIKYFQRTITTSSKSTIYFIKSIGKINIVSVASIVSFIKSIGKLTITTSVIKIILNKLVNRTISIISSSTLNFIRSINKIILTISSTKISFVKLIGKLLTTTSNVIVSLLRPATHVLNFVVTSVSTVFFVKSIGKLLTTTSNVIVSVLRPATHLLNLIVTSVSTVSFVKSIGKLLTTTSNVIVSLLRPATHILNFVVTSKIISLSNKTTYKIQSVLSVSTGTFLKSVNKFTVITSSINLSFIKSLNKTLVTSSNLIVTQFKSIIKIYFIILGSTSLFFRFVTKILLTTEKSNISFVKLVNKNSTVLSITIINFLKSIIKILTSILKISVSILNPATHVLNLIVTSVTTSSFIKAIQKGINSLSLYFTDSITSLFGGSSFGLYPFGYLSNTQNNSFTKFITKSPQTTTNFITSSVNKSAQKINLTISNCQVSFLRFINKNIIFLSKINLNFIKFISKSYSTIVNIKSILPILRYLTLISYSNVISNNVKLINKVVDIKSNATVYFNKLINKFVVSTQNITSIIIKLINKIIISTSNVFVLLLEPVTHILNLFVTSISKITVAKNINKFVFTISKEILYFIKSPQKYFYTSLLSTSIFVRYINKNILIFATTLLYNFNKFIDKTTFILNSNIISNIRKSILKTANISVISKELVSFYENVIHVLYLIVNSTPKSSFSRYITKFVIGIPKIIPAISKFWKFSFSTNNIIIGSIYKSTLKAVLVSSFSNYITDGFINLIGGSGLGFNPFGSGSSSNTIYIQKSVLKNINVLSKSNIIFVRFITKFVIGMPKIIPTISKFWNFIFSTISSNNVSTIKAMQKGVNSLSLYFTDSITSLFGGSSFGLYPFGYLSNAQNNSFTKFVTKSIQSTPTTINKVIKNAIKIPFISNSNIILTITKSILKTASISVISKELVSFFEQATHYLNLIVVSTTKVSVTKFITRSILSLPKIIPAISKFWNFSFYTNENIKYFFNKTSAKQLNVISFSNYITDGFINLLGGSGLGFNPFGSGSSSNQILIQKSVLKNVNLTSKSSIIFLKVVNKLLILVSLTISTFNKLMGKQLSVTSNIIVSLLRPATHVLNFVVTSVSKISFIKLIGKQLSTVSIVIVSLLRPATHLLNLIVTSIAKISFVKLISKQLSITSNIIVSLLRPATHVLNFVVTSVSKISFNKLISKQLSVTSNIIVSLLRPATHLLNFVVTSVSTVSFVKLTLKSFLAVSFSNYISDGFISLLGGSGLGFNPFGSGSSSNTISIQKSVLKNVNLTSKSSIIFLKVVNKLLISVSLTISSIFKSINKSFIAISKEITNLYKNTQKIQTIISKSTIYGIKLVNKNVFVVSNIVVSLLRPATHLLNLIVTSISINSIFKSINRSFIVTSKEIVAIPKNVWKIVLSSSKTFTIDIKFVNKLITTIETISPILSRSATHLLNFVVTSIVKPSSSKTIIKQLNVSSFSNYISDGFISLLGGSGIGFNPFGSGSSSNTISIQKSVLKNVNVLSKSNIIFVRFITKFVISISKEIGTFNKLISNSIISYSIISINIQKLLLKVIDSISLYFTDSITSLFGGSSFGVYPFGYLSNLQNNSFTKFVSKSTQTASNIVSNPIIKVIGKLNSTTTNIKIIILKLVNKQISTISNIIVSVLRPATHLLNLIVTSVFKISFVKLINKQSSSLSNVIVSLLRPATRFLNLIVTSTSKISFVKNTKKELNVVSFSNYITDGFINLLGGSGIGFNPFGSGASNNQISIQKSVLKNTNTLLISNISFVRFINKVIIVLIQQITNINKLINKQLSTISNIIVSVLKPALHLLNLIVTSVSKISFVKLINKQLSTISNIIVSLLRPTLHLLNLIVTSASKISFVKLINKQLSSISNVIVSLLRPATRFLNLIVTSTSKISFVKLINKQLSLLSNIIISLSRPAGIFVLNLIITSTTKISFVKLIKKELSIISFSNYITDGFINLLGGSGIGFNPFGSGSSSNQIIIQKSVLKNTNVLLQSNISFIRFINKFVIKTSIVIPTISKFWNFIFSTVSSNNVSLFKTIQKGIDSLSLYFTDSVTSLFGGSSFGVYPFGYLSNTQNNSIIKIVLKSTQTASNIVSNPIIKVIGKLNSTTTNIKIVLLKLFNKQISTISNIIVSVLRPAIRFLNLIVTSVSKTAFIKLINKQVLIISNVIVSILRIATYLLNLVVTSVSKISFIKFISRQLFVISKEIINLITQTIRNLNLIVTSVSKISLSKLIFKEIKTYATSIIYYVKLVYKLIITNSLEKVVIAFNTTYKLILSVTSNILNLNKKDAFKNINSSSIFVKNSLLKYTLKNVIVTSTIKINFSKYLTKSITVIVSIISIISRPVSYLLSLIVKSTTNNLIVKSVLKTNISFSNIKVNFNKTIGKVLPSISKVLILLLFPVKFLLSLFTTSVNNVLLNKITFKTLIIRVNINVIIEKLIQKLNIIISKISINVIKSALKIIASIVNVIGNYSRGALNFILRFSTDAISNINFEKSIIKTFNSKFYEFTILLKSTNKNLFVYIDQFLNIQRFIFKNINLNAIQNAFIGQISKFLLTLGTATTIITPKINKRINLLFLSTSKIINISFITVWLPNFVKKFFSAFFEKEEIKYIVKLDDELVFKGVLDVEDDC